MMNENDGMDKLPEYLESTYRMLISAFPDGIDETLYFSLLAVLNEEMSHKNIAHVISYFTGKNKGMVTNDIYKIYHASIDRNDTEKLKKHLSKHGYEEWLREE